MNVLFTHTTLCPELIALVCDYLRIRDHTPVHSYLTKWSIVQRRYPTALAVQPNDTILALTPLWRVFTIFPHGKSRQWNLPATLTTLAHPLTSLAFSPRSNQILLATPNQIDLFSPDGVWQRRFPTAGPGPLAVSPYGQVFLGHGPQIRVYKEHSGRLRRTLHWTNHTYVTPRTLALDHDRIWVTGGTETRTWIVALNLRSGLPLLQWPWPQPILSLTIAPNGDLWVSHEHTSGFTVVSRHNGQRLHTVGGIPNHHEHNSLAVNRRGEALVLNAFSGLIKLYE